MTAKQKTGKGRKAAKSVPIAYHIRVNAEADGSFKYSADGIPDASSLRPHIGDTIKWTATLMGFPTSFQVEFPGFGPFGGVNQVVRSMFQTTDPLTVTVPSYYHGNLVFKYTVTIANGWSDDPDVEPVPSDGVATDAITQVISLSIVGGNLTLDNPNASFSEGEVAWKWAQTPLDDFSITFDAPVPAGWPPQTDSQAQRITLNLQTAGSQFYTLQTLNLGLSVRGKLTIS
jgi:hypothetical protein